MNFGQTFLADAEGAILAHAVRLPGQQFRKGRVLSRADLDALEAAGITEIIAARLDPADVPEDRAATRAAMPLVGTGIARGEAFTGRVNLFAETHGLLVLDRDGIDTLNRIDQSVTVATLEPFAPVTPRQMVATIKIIPFAAPEAVIGTWEASARPLKVAPFRGRPVALIQTTLPGLKPGVLDKTVEITRRRLEGIGCTLMAETRTEHRPEPVGTAIRAMIDQGAELVLVAGASAIVDRRDVIPAGIVEAGGAIEYFGMPVDPGNLMLTGHVGEVPVLGLPGCARSPKLNGFDWVLQRLIADLPVGPAELAGLGVGGLLAEIPSRPLPRAEIGRAQPPSRPRIAAIVLAAGQSSRMGRNKLLIEIDGASMVERAVDAALASAASPVIVVLGHQADSVRARLAGRKVVLVKNPDYAQGLSTSLKRGLAAVPDEADGIVVCLADMPGIGQRLIDRLIAAFNPLEGREIIVPSRDGKRGNPVLWGSRFLPELATVSGDTGAKHLLGAYPEYLVEIVAEDDGVLTDLDTPEALAAWRARTV
ncbi:MAG TPA: molybdopterin-binding/glycosyltransferase family 2 protein [Aliidongia sp.]|nr:molybdopterin-binding/glycosyltransferase family 2 protein [Aliidongia sp.]